MKAISPVIATVIIVAVAIAISVAVAIWITSVTGNMGSVEELKIFNSYGTYNTSTTPVTAKIVLNVTNTGTKDVVIKGIKINGVSLRIDEDNVEIAGDVTISNGEVIVPQNGGGAIILKISNPDIYKIKPGGSATVVLISSSGQKYSVVVQILAQ